MKPAIVPVIQQALSSFPELKLAIVFGSAAKDRLLTDSDIDIAVKADQRLQPDTILAIMDCLALATGRAVDVVDLSTAGEPLLGQILVTGHRIAGSYADYASLLNKHWLDEADFMPYQRRILRERRQLWLANE